MRSTPASSTSPTCGVPATRSEASSIPAGVNASTSYPIATLTTAANQVAATAFTDYVLSGDGASALSAAGFAKP